MTTVFYALYAVGWGIILTSGGRYLCFEPHLLLGSDGKARGRALNRFLLGIALLVLAPAGWLVLTQAWVTAGKGSSPLMVSLSAALAAFSIFGWVRILHAFCATERLYPEFYTEEEWRRLPGVERCLAQGANTFTANLWTGVGMVTVPTIAAKLLSL